MAEFISVINWAKFQHYKDRNPPWIKLHRDLMTSETWVSLDDAGRVLAIAIMMLAAATDNKIRADKRYVQRVAYLHNEPDFQPLIDIGFIEIIDENGEVASTLQADARPETEAYREETEREREKKDTPKPPSQKPTPRKPKAEEAFTPPDWIPPEAWAGFLEHRRKGKSPFTIRAQQLTVTELDKLRRSGNDPEAVLNQSVMRGWQGVFKIAQDFSGNTTKGNENAAPSHHRTNPADALAAGFDRALAIHQVQAQRGHSGDMGSAEEGHSEAGTGCAGLLP